MREKNHGLNQKFIKFDDLENFICVIFSQPKVLTVKRLLAGLVGVTLAEVMVSDGVIQEVSMEYCCMQWCGHPRSLELTREKARSSRTKFLRVLCQPEIHCQSELKGTEKGCIEEIVNIMADPWVQVPAQTQDVGQLFQRIRLIQN